VPWRSLTKFSKKLSPGQGRRAANQANAILRSGAPEGVAIATALKHANKADHLKRRGLISEKAASKHLDVDATATTH